jgi:hypothetical protein
MTENPVVMAAIASSLLGQGQSVDRLSRGLTLIGCLAIFVGTYLGAPWPLAMVAAIIVLAGLAQTYFAVRIGFDAALFEHMAREAFGTASFDAAMGHLHLMKPERTPRPMAMRVAGAMALMRRQTIMLGMQIIALLVLPIVGLLW